MDSGGRHSAMPGARFVDPTALARIGNLELLARTVVDGFINGLHRSPYFGASVDFAEHRGYTPGDDIRRVDWRLYARTDRYYVKQYEADSNANFAVLLDVSRSMSYASTGLSKFDYGRYLAACLTYFAHRQRDRVGIITFDQDIVDHVPCSAKHLDMVLHTIDRAQAGRAGNLTTPLAKAAEHFGRRGILVLISDLYETPDAVLDAVKLLRYRGRISRSSICSTPPRSTSASTRHRASRTWRAVNNCRSYRRRWQKNIGVSSESTSRHCRRSCRRTGSTTRSSTRAVRSTTRCSATSRRASD